MDLIIVFIIFSIIMNIIGTAKKQNRKQAQTTGRKTPKSSASRGRGLRNLLEDETFIRPKQQILDSRPGKAERIIDNSFMDSDRKSHFSEVKKPLRVSSPSQEHRSTSIVDLTDMQRAIVMAEVLGKPKALKR